MAAHDRGDRVWQIGREILERRVDDPTKPARSQPALSSRLINWHDTANFERSRELLFRGVGGIVRLPNNLELRLGELEFTFPVVLLHLAIERDDLPGLKLFLKIWSIEPDALQPRPALPGGHLKDGHAAGPEQSRGSHLGDYGRHLSGAEFGNAPRLQPVLVAKGQVVQQ